MWRHMLGAVAQPLPRSFAARQRLEDEAKIARIVAEAEPAPAPGSAGRGVPARRAAPARGSGIAAAAARARLERLAAELGADAYGLDLRTIAGTDSGLRLDHVR
jgi:hypothetical protein